MIDIDWAKSGHTDVVLMQLQSSSGVDFPECSCVGRTGDRAANKSC